MEHEVAGKLRAQVAAWRYGNPSRGMKVIAVAGASGKSTTVLLLGELLQEAGRSVMTLTDRGCFYNGLPVATSYDHSADSVQRCMSTAKKKSVDYVIVEISDDLIATQVLPTLLLTMSVVTNESPSAKALLDQPVEYTVVPSGFDVAGLAVVPHQDISFGEDAAAEAQIVAVNERRKGTEIDLVIDHQTKVSLATYLVGKANAMNVAAAVASAYVLATDTSTFEEGAARLERVVGNYDYLKTDLPYDVVVDGAKNEHSIRMIVESAAKLKRRRLLIAADASVPNERYTDLKRLSDRLVVVGDSLELPGVERAETLQAAFDLVKRSAKKDDTVLLLGTDYAKRDEEGRTFAHTMVQGTDE